MMDKGKYDKAITLAIKKLQRKPDNKEQLNVLQQSYTNANAIDNERIKFLKLSGQPDIWDEVFKRLESLKSRQQRVSLLNKSILNSIGFVAQDYDLQIVEAERNAANYFFANGKRLLQKGDRFNARLAYEEFQKVRQYFASYPDLENLMNEARFKGTSFVYFSMKNLSGIPLPQRFEEELFRISLHDLNTRWINFHTTKTENYNYTYNINLNIRRIMISPELIKEKNYQEQKRVEDGWEYVLDKNGNVLKDSLGNDIKVKKYSVISCDVIETNMSKSVLISGTLEFTDNTNRQLIKTDPITAEYFFNHTFAVARGNFNALKRETLELTKRYPMAFPPDPDMLMNANEILKQITKDVITKNRNLLR